jgi:hypothetical protein
MNPPRIVVFPLVLAASFGCATKRLPPGTPPPEYEKRTFEPWSPLEPDAGADAAAPAAPPAGPAPMAPPEPLPASPIPSVDAGPPSAP